MSHEVLVEEEDGVRVITINRPKARNAVTGAPMRDGEIITPDLPQGACARAGATISKGDVVLLRTGWLESCSPSNRADFNREPGIGVEAAFVLAKSGSLGARLLV